MKSLKYAVITLSVIFILLFILPFMINWDSYYKNYVARNLEKNYSEYSIKSIGKVRVRFIFPKITVDTLQIEYKENENSSIESENVVIIDKVELYPSFISLIRLSPRLQKLTFYKPMLSLKIFEKILAIKGNSDIKVINIINGILSINIQHNKEKNFYLDNALVKINNMKQRVLGKFKINDSEYKFSILRQIQKQGKYNIISEIISPTVKVVLSGTESKGHFLGKSQIKGNNLGSFITDIALNNQLSFLRIIKSQEEFSISSDFIFADSGFRFYNFIVNAKSLEAVADVKYNKGEYCDFNMKFTKVDIDSLILKSEDKEYKNKAFFFHEPSFLLSKKINLNLKINGHGINYRGKLSNDFIMDAKVLDGNIKVDRLVMKLPGNNNVLNIFGVVTSDSVRSKFDGKILVKGDDFDYLTEWLISAKVKDSHKVKNEFLIDGDIYIAPRIFSISNMIISTLHGDMKGNFRVKYNAKKRFANGNINIKGIDFDRYIFVNDSKINKNRDDIIPMKWLRDINCDIELNINMNNFNLFDKNIEKFSSVVKVAKEQLEFEDLSFLGKDSTNLKGSVRVSIDNNIKPRFFIKLVSDKYSNRFIQFTKFREILRTPSGKINEVKWSTDAIDFFGLENFNGSFNINIGELITDEGSIKDFIFTSNLQDNLMTINKCSFRYKEGTVDMNARLGLGSDTSLTATFSAVSIEFGTILNTVLGIDIIKGIASFSGFIKTQGKSMLEWLNRLDGDIELAAVNLDVDGINISNFVKNLFTVNNKSDVAYLSKISLYEGSTHINTLESKININNGNALISSQFTMDRFAGSFSASFSFVKCIVDSIFRFFFILGSKNSQAHIDMSLQGIIWNPKITFDIDDLYSIVTKNR